MRHISDSSCKGEDNIENEMMPLYSIMEKESLSFSRNIDSYLRTIWTSAQDEGLEYDLVQVMLNGNADWITQIELNGTKFTDLLD